MERIGWRALLASLAALAIAATVTLSMNFADRGGDFDPGVRSLVQMENIRFRENSSIAMRPTRKIVVEFVAFPDRSGGGGAG